MVPPLLRREGDRGGVGVGKRCHVVSLKRFYVQKGTVRESIRKGSDGRKEIRKSTPRTKEEIVVERGGKT